ncbi:polar amino acid transport system substrate-binding protein [Pseudomonas japonica]|uniref:Polar amino acid transport system substrate-binding protein n=2 Tax=Pseudomonas japonica TaxID=256466 RepID=A0A239EF15_9PSED|nr:transporter substrate-binding domain-containing protein [Pseudomonas japonica]SNS42504.1 polar amino acid transport system substrate-binding protein [Pseudomonas japonica]
MRKWRQWLLLVAMLAGMLGIARAEDLPSEVRLASENWQDYTNADGTGLAWDVLRQVFEPAGVKVRVLSAPYTRAIGLVKRGEADAWVGSYHEESADNLYPRWNFDSDHIYALGLVSKPLPTPDNIGQFRLSWVRGYDYQRYLPNVGYYREVQRRDGILPMLERERVDFYIDALTEVNDVLAQAEHPEKFRSIHVAELPLYLAFGNTPQGKALRDLFDRRMDELVRSDALKPIFQQWKQPYPFDQSGR